MSKNVRATGKRRGRPRGPSETTRARLAAYAELGPPPADPLEAVAWTGQALAVALHEVLTDAKLGARQRRAELRALARVQGSLIPAERLLQAERVVRSAQAAILETDGGAKLVDVTGEPGRPLRLDAAPEPSRRRRKRDEEYGRPPDPDDSEPLQ